MSIRLQTGDIGRHNFRDLLELLSSGDLLVVNETRVIPALLTGRKPTGGRVELLVVDPADSSAESGRLASAERTCLVRSSKPLAPGTAIRLDDGPVVKAMETVCPGRVKIDFRVPECAFLDFLAAWGKTPLPPYITRGCSDEAVHSERYQTVYATTAGSVAAPTAGLHFTEDLLQALRGSGIEIARVLLHVGPGTFVPVRDDDIRRHRMAPEFYEISEVAAERLGRAQREGRRIIAVGTTSMRSLESAADENGIVRPGQGRTDLFIKPGHRFKVARSLITNFHLPCSTLLVLVCSLAGLELTMKAYRTAIEARYRFYSYGDACLFLE
jgi:S-adenosylmethionine:tRNA ribosyltransferase-isomerase